jgi:hypothetical protein
MSNTRLSHRSVACRTLATQRLPGLGGLGEALNNDPRWYKQQDVQHIQKLMS